MRFTTASSKRRISRGKIMSRGPFISSNSYSSLWLYSGLIKKLEHDQFENFGGACGLHAAHEHEICTIGFCLFCAKTQRIPVGEVHSMFGRFLNFSNHQGDSSVSNSAYEMKDTVQQVPTEKKKWKRSAESNEQVEMVLSPLLVMSGLTTSPSCTQSSTRTVRARKTM